MKQRFVSFKNCQLFKKKFIDPTLGHLHMIYKYTKDEHAI
jgi:hypothetical protein